MAFFLHLSDTEIAWIAGLLEGEGSFSFDKRPSKRYKVSTAPPAPTIQISMIDEDVIKYLANLLNKKYSEVGRRTVKNKPVYKLNVRDRETLSYLLPCILPYMGKRRSEQIQKGIDSLNAWKKWKDEGGRSLMAKEGSKVLFNRPEKEEEK